MLTSFLQLLSFLSFSLSPSLSLSLSLSLFTYHFISSSNSLSFSFFKFLSLAWFSFPVLCLNMALITRKQKFLAKLKKKKPERKKIESFKLDMRTSAAPALAWPYILCSPQHNVVDHLSCWQCHASPTARQSPRLKLVCEFFSHFRSVTKRVRASLLEAIAIARP